MLESMPDFFSAADLILSSSDDSSSGEWKLIFLAMGPFSAFGFFMAIWRRYRNTDKSYQYERDTAIEAQPATGWDVKVGSKNRQKREEIEGRNSGKNRQRVQRVSMPPVHGH